MQMFEPTEVDARNSVDSEPENSDSGAKSGESGDTDSDFSSDSGDDLPAASDHAPIDQIFSTKNGKQRATKSPKVTIAPLLRSLQPPDAAKLERRRFMSHKAVVVSGAVPLPPTSRRKKPEKEEGDFSGLTKEEFQKLQREVHLNGKYSYRL